MTPGATGAAGAPALEAPTGSRAAVTAGDRVLAEGLRDALGDGASVSVDEFDRVVAAVDASHFLLTPRAVVTPRTTADVAAAFAYAAAEGLHVTLRSGGTSLSGQATSDGIVLDTRSAFRRIDVGQGGETVRVQPGATVRQVNTRLLRHGRKLGPDPASEIAATIGGVIANNSSGMACGTHHNSYRTLRALTAVLPSGTIVDTGDPDADARLAAAEPVLHAGLAGLRDRVRARDDLRTEIERQYRGKNTMGYGLNSLLDFERPVDMLAHLLVGSEGTLAFVAEAEFDTVPIAPAVATALLVLPSLDAATRLLPLLVETDAATIELMDAASLRVIQADPTSEGVLDGLDVDHHAALLVEYHAADTAALDDLVARAGAALAASGASPALDATRDPARRATLWHLRKGLYAAIAGARPPGTTALLEDIAVPVPALAETCAALQQLFARHGYPEAVIFGHAKDGNIHFLLVEDFAAPGAIDRQRVFTEELVELVLARGGTLKAEHGTGRIMAPFVERQFGPELFAVMRELKRLFDPHGILSPGVLLGGSPEGHLEHLKATPEVEHEVDRCVECGYCEPVCPSKDLTLTPRQRIAVRRARAAARAAGDDALDERLARGERYASTETCAADGMCQTACPVLINTGDLVRRLRETDASAPVRAGGAVAARSWGVVSRGAATALTAAKAVGPVAQVASTAARAVLGSDLVPQWTPDLPRGGAPRRRAGDASPAEADLVLFSACVGSMFGPAPADEGHGIGAEEAFRRLCERAGLRIASPDGIEGLCCGTPWKSKGLADGYAVMVERTADALVAASDHGRLPIVCDNSSCTEGLELALAKAAERSAHPLRVVDATVFAAEHVLPRLTVGRRLDSVVVHPTCSSTRLGANPALLAIAGAIADETVVPDAWGCCGFAGDRGMLHPELTASATAAEAAEVTARDFGAHVSCNRTCELGMTRATGRDYRHILEVLEELQRPGSPRA